MPDTEAAEQAAEFPAHTAVAKLISQGTREHHFDVPAIVQAVLDNLPVEVSEEMARRAGEVIRDHDMLDTEWTEIGRLALSAALPFLRIDR